MVLRRLPLPSMARAVGGVISALLALTGCIGDPPTSGDGGRRQPPTTVAPQQAPSGSGAVPELTVRAMAAGLSIKIDGQLDEPAWATAADTGHFVNPGTGRPAPRGSVGGSAKLLYDSEFLFVGFDVRDSTVRGGFPRDAVDPHLWERDTVEIMIDPDGDGDNVDYYEIQINPQNLVFDSRFDRYNQPRGGKAGPFGHQSWRAGVTSAIEIHGTLDDDSDRDRGYAVEAKIPWSSFAKAKHSPPRPGDRWRMNFYAMQNNGGVAWSPILGQGNFHRASRFGRVRWIAAAGASAATTP